MRDEVEGYIILPESSVTILKDNITLPVLDLPETHNLKVIIQKEDGNTIVSELLHVKETQIKGETVKTLEPVYSKIDTSKTPQFRLGETQPQPIEEQIKEQREELKQ